MGADGIRDAYRTGRGTIRIRAVTAIEQAARGKAIVLTEIPYQTSVDAIAGKLAEAVESGRIDGIRDIRNESGQGQRARDRAATRRQRAGGAQQPVQAHARAESVPVNTVAFVDGVPRTLNLQEALQHGSTIRLSW